jgi:hypothetical protein
LGARQPAKQVQMRFVSDVLVLFGGILLVFGSDLVVETAGQNLASVGGLLGMIASLLGVALLITGLLGHYRLSRERANLVRPEIPAAPRR